MSGKPFDATLKELMGDYLTAWPALLGSWPVEEAVLVDTDLSTVTDAADRVVRVRGGGLEWIFNPEAQGNHELGLPGRLHLYSTLLRDRHGLLVRSVVVLLRREANASDLTGVYQLQFPDEAEPYEVFRYHVVRLWEMPLQPLLTASVGLLPLAPLTDEAAPKLPAVVEAVKDRFDKELPPADAGKLLTATFVLLGLRYEETLVNQLYRGVTSMEESSTYRFIINKGAVGATRKMLVLVGTERFGDPDQRIKDALQSIDNLAQLEQLGRALPHVSSWDELLATPAH